MFWVLKAPIMKLSPKKAIHQAAKSPVATILKKLPIRLQRLAFSEEISSLETTTTSFLVSNVVGEIL